MDFILSFIADNSDKILLLAGGLVTGTAFGVVSTAVKIVRFIKHKDNSYLEQLGEQWGMKLSAYGRRKLGVNWEVAEDPLLGGLVALFSGIQRGANKDD